MTRTVQYYRSQYKRKEKSPKRLRRDRERNKRLLLIVLLCVFLSLWGHNVYNWLGNSQWFHIKNIDVSGLKYLNKNEIVKILDLPENTNLFNLNVHILEQRLREHPRLKTIKVKKQLFNTLTITIEERLPYALINLNSLYEIDEEGVLLPPVRYGVQPDLPIITGIETEEIRLGEPLEADKLDLALDLTKRLRLLNQPLIEQISEIHITNSNEIILCTLHEGIQIRLNNIEEPKLIYLRGVLDDIKKRQVKITSLDLRFDNQVIASPNPIAELGIRK